MGEGGLQDVYYGIRDKTRAIADQHANLGRTIDSSIVQHLQKLRTEIKAHIKNIQNDTGKLATTVAKERELSARMIGDLATSISVFKNTPMEVNSKTDPYVTNAHVIAQLTKQVHAENSLQKSIIIMQQNSAHFEEGLVRALQSAWATFDEWQSRMSVSVQETWRAMGTSLSALAPDAEWIEFAARSDQLVDPETPLRNPQAIQYPSKTDPAVLAVHTGYLERKKRFTRHYKESYYVLTPAGFLHEYASSDPAQSAEPLWSLFLPACTLGPPSKSTALSGSHKFHIEWKRNPREAVGTKPTGLKRLSTLGRSNASAYSFRARSHAEMMEWWNDVRMLCSRYLVASEEVARQGPVMAAVRQAGYASDSESGSDEGSSVEEEAEDDGVYVDAPSAAGTLPAYDHHHHHTPVKAGQGTEQNGYQLTDNGVKRQPSKRQMEKAPEGRGPHVDVDDACPTEDVGTDEEDPRRARASKPSESRFTENV
jgi:hypothetical protein